MTDLFFVDSNVLLYRRDASFETKQKTADEWIRKLWTERSGRLSVQVLNEFYVTATQKLKPGMPRKEARAEVQDFLTWEPVALSAELIRSAFEVQTRYEISYWDSLIVSAALAARCNFLLTEDLQDGQDFGGLKVVDPFAHPPRG